MEDLLVLTKNHEQLHPKINTFIKNTVIHRAHLDIEFIISLLILFSKLLYLWLRPFAR